jgi:hypothetical protein
MKRISVVIVLMFLTLRFVLAQSCYPITLECSMHSDTLGCDKSYCIYLPESYGDESKSFPVLYLLHGLTDNDRAWRDKGKVDSIATKIFALGTAQEMIIVMPDAGTAFDGYFNCEGWRYESFFFSEFIPHIEGKYRIKADKGHRAIAGLSMGGGGTTGYALRHSDMFSSAYAMSALMGMVENLLSVTRIDNGNVKLIKTPVVLEELIDSVLVRFRKRYPKQSVKVELPEEFVMIPMDAVLVEQVIVNILENAVQHAIGMTELTLKVLLKDTKAVFEIHDNGCGICDGRWHAR